MEQAKENFINFRPIVIAGVSMIIGILATYFSIYFKPTILIVGGVITIIAVIFFLLKRSTKNIVFSLIFVLCFFIGFLSFSICAAKLNSVKNYDKQTVNFNGVVTDITQIDDDYKAIKLSFIKGINANGTNIIIYSNSDIKRGDVVTYNGTLTFIELSSNNSLSNFSSLSGEGELIFNNETLAIYTFYNYIENTLKDNLPSNVFGVALGLLTGNVDYLSESKLLNYRLSGVAHIFAVSGLHIGFIATMIGFLCGILKIKGYKKSILVILLSIFYSGVCGFSLSSLRAVVMVTVSSICSNFGRKYDLLNSCCIALIFLLIIAPQGLFSYGFILSFIAIISISLFNNGFKKFYSFMPKTLCEAFASSTSVILGSSPIIISMFGYTSIFSLLLNIVLIPIIAIVFSLLLIVLLLTIIKPLSFLWSVPFFTLNIIDKLMGFVDFSRLAIFGSVSIIGIILYYLFLIFACDKINLNRKIKNVSLLLSFLSLTLSIGGII